MAVTTLKDRYQQRQDESAGKINTTYDKQYDAQASQLKTEYDRSYANKQAEMSQIAPQYQTQANTLAANYERQRRNANLNAMNSGLGSGTAQQQQLALQNQYVGNYGALRGQEAAAVNAGNQQLSDLTTAYNDNLAKARSSIEAKRDQELINNYNANRDWYEKAAAQAAASGDFSAFQDIYGKKQAQAARNEYIAKDPYSAYQRGMITEAQFKKITGFSVKEIQNSPNNRRNAYRKQYGIST